MQIKGQIVSDAAALSRAAANVFIATANHAAEKKGAFTVALSGGSTPKALYSLLTTDRDLHARVPWQRHVPPDHPGSNHRAELLDHPLLDFHGGQSGKFLCIVRRKLLP